MQLALCLYHLDTTVSLSSNHNTTIEKTCDDMKVAIVRGKYSLIQPTHELWHETASHATLWQPHLRLVCIGPAMTVL